VLTLDVGTSSVRASLFDICGCEISGAQARVEHSFCTTLDGGAEADAEKLVADITQVIDAVLKEHLPSNASLEAVAICCFWHSLVGVDARGEAITPVFGWADRRAARAAEELRNRFDERAAHARTGCRFHASYWPAKLLWLRTEHTKLYGRVAHWLSFSDYLIEKFCATNNASTRTNISMASGTGLLNVHSCTWDAELLTALDIRRDHLPPIACAEQNYESHGALKNEYTRRWPQLSTARWFLAVGDGAANNVGAGCVSSSQVALMIGTSGAMRVLSDSVVPDVLPSELWCYRVDEKRIVVGGALSDGGGLYQWMIERLRIGERAEIDDESLEHQLASLPADRHGLTLLPFWAGERSTGWSDFARGAILGLTMHTRPIEILRAAMEAVAYRFALIYDALKKIHAFDESSTIYASGGALEASSVWGQMLADVLGREIKLSNVPEASSRGAALLALEQLGKIKRIAAPTPVAGERVYEPDMANHVRYRMGLVRQQKVYEHLISDQYFVSVINQAVPEQSSQSVEARCHNLEMREKP
jgi:gluconokinase